MKSAGILLGFAMALCAVPAAAQRYYSDEEVRRFVKDGPTVEELTGSLNPNRLPQFEAVATVGHGVFDTLKAIAKLVLMELKKAAP